MIIDLRSDTVTKPSKAMLEAMMNAEVGDDVFNEDPTVKKLEQKLATMFGHEAGLFCPSGTMTNQIAINVHTRPGDEVICDVNSHIYNYEGGGISKNSGVQAKLLQGDRGRLSLKQIQESINGDFDWLTRSTLVSLENTVNRAGGSFYQLKDIKEISEFCRSKKINFHLDGARIFNALVETGESAEQYGRLFDSVSICLSKGLGTPAGSVLVGNKNFIKEARRVRKVFGGGMRQVGILAAAGLFALENNITRLKEDHKKARKIEETLKKCAFIESVLPVHTNIVIFNLNSSISGELFEKKLSENNIKISAFGKQTIRMVTHMDFTDEMLDKTIKILKAI
ncbi:MAG: aminotransferase class I/II-fold pyridoxal phosphate-dependent enzyme [Bacteroidia bacterium]|nr:aminotransferase class I/II-fold pyridoxal phosphate-dependent enzyme [Bacteroidia bacterium]